MAGRGGRLRRGTDATRAAWEQVFSGPMRRPAPDARAGHPLPSRPRRPVRLAVPAFQGAVLDHHRRIRLRAHDVGRRCPAWTARRRFPIFKSTAWRAKPCWPSLKRRRNYFPSLVPAVPLAYTRMQHGDVVTIGEHGWRVITGFGHSPEHASLYCEELHVLISGDMVLPRISTNVSVFAVEPEGNPLQLYLDSLDRFAELPRRHPGAALPRPSVPRFAHAHRNSCATTMRRAWTRWRPPAPRPSLPWTSCR